ncbi:MAG: AAA family ATPase [Candidatus Dadabacteria bacterium]|nr:MAG: AAA family ATPase [Candidatus Dadabacteria bacterium]
MSKKNGKSNGAAKKGFSCRLDYSAGNTADSSSEIKISSRLKQFLEKGTVELSEDLAAQREALGIVAQQRREKKGFASVGTPSELIAKLEKVGYHCLPYLAVQMALILNTPATRVRAILLEGPTGCGKSFMAKSLAKITGAEFMCLSCYRGMNTDYLIEQPSSFALAKAMAGKLDDTNDLMQLGIISRAYLKSQEKPVILLIDELDKPDESIDTFFLGPIQDSKVWLQSRGPIEADPENMLIIFTKNYNRKIDDALYRRVHPITMTYLNADLERKILSPYCHPKIIENLVELADIMRYSDGSYQFDRPPAPEELLYIGLYIMRLLEWNITDFATVGEAIWTMVSKSEHDRAVLEHMLKFHPNFLDLYPQEDNDLKKTIYKKLGRFVLKGVIQSPEDLYDEKKLIM